MSLSSLPDIFRKVSIEPGPICKQGGSFSLRLNLQSPDKHISSRAGYAPGDLNRGSYSASKRRSASTASVRAKPCLFREESPLKPGTAREKMTVGFKDEVEFWTSGPLRQKVGFSIVNISNFPYETSRRINNMTIDLEQSDSLKNRTDFQLKEAAILTQNLQDMQSLTKQTRNQYQSFINVLLVQMGQFQASFSKLLEQTYSSLSKLRRETNEELKQNKLSIDKLQNQIDTCQNFCRDLQQKTTAIYQECLSAPREASRADTPFLDFEEISSIPKESRGATGDLSRRTKIVQLLRKEEANPRKSADMRSHLPNEGMVLRGKQIEVLNFDDC